MKLLSFSFKWILLFHLEINHRLHIFLYSENKCLSFKHSYLNHYLFLLAHKIQHTNNMGGCCWGWIVLASLKQYFSNMPYFAHFLPCLIPSLKTLLLSLISLPPLKVPVSLSWWHFYTYKCVFMSSLHLIGLQCFSPTPTDSLPFPTQTHSIVVLFLCDHWTSLRLLVGPWGRCLQKQGLLIIFFTTEGSLSHPLPLLLNIVDL